MLFRSLIPLFAGVIVSDEDVLLLTAMLSAMLVLAGIGVIFFIRAGIIQESFEKLLQEGDYTRLEKKNKPVTSTVAIVYWLTVTAIFLVYLAMIKKDISTIGIRYNDSWVIWAVAAVLYPAVAAVTKILVNRNRKAS